MPRSADLHAKRASRSKIMPNNGIETSQREAGLRFRLQQITTSYRSACAAVNCSRTRIGRRLS